MIADLVTLRCPACLGCLSESDNSVCCSSSECCAVYPVVNGIPILLAKDCEVFDVASYSAGPVPSSQARKFQDALFGILPGIDLNLSAKANMRRIMALLAEQNDRPTVLNIGGKHPTSATASVCNSELVNCIEVDLVLRARTTVVADPHQLPLPDESVDAVLIDAMLEHVLDPPRVVREAFRVLKKGGLIYGDTPFMLQVHGGALDFMRYTHLGHRRLFRQFEEISSGITAGPGVALTYSLQYFFLSFVKARFSRFAISLFCRVFFFWIKYFDYILVRKPGAMDAAHGYYFLGRKSERALADEDLIAGYRGNTKAFYPMRPKATAPVSSQA